MPLPPDPHSIDGTRREFIKTAGALAFGLTQSQPSEAAAPANSATRPARITTPGHDATLRIASFQADVTPPLGSPLCEALVKPARKIVDPLSARGVVLLTSEKPIVLCALDYTSIQNGGYRAWREALAKAAGTTPDRVAVHTLHQHDAPSVDFDLEELLAPRGLSGSTFDVPSSRAAIARTAEALGRAIEHPRPVTQVGAGLAKVDRVASNRRVLGPDGKVLYQRQSSCTDAEAIAAPEGTIDPNVKLVSFWDGDEPLVSLTYYATHPQSFYRRGAVSADFVGLARGLREATAPEIAHVHFNGAGGNIAAGKYNDGTPLRRFELAGRLADGMARAWEDVKKTPLRAEDVGWQVLPVKFPLSPSLTEAKCLAVLDDPQKSVVDRAIAASELIWARRSARGEALDLGCLRLGDIRVLHLPGEIFVEYQLAAAAMRPDLLVCVAAYGDCAVQYVGTQIAYSQGGYEVGQWSRVAPETEQVLMPALRTLLT